MLYIIYILIFLAALAELIFLEGSKVGAIAVILLCITFVVAKVLLKDKISKQLQNMFMIMGVVIAALFMLNIGLKGSEGGVLNYNDKLAQVTEYLADGNYSKASKLLESIDEEYGSSDAGYILSAIHNLEIGDVLAAKDDFQRIYDKKQITYYALGEQIYKNDFSGDALDNLYALYVEAANEHPTWNYMQFWAGVSRFEQKNYKSAEYYLLNAYNLEEDNSSTLYYLGAVKYAQNDYEEALEYFDMSIEAGANETICSYIAWYLQQMGY